MLSQVALLLSSIAAVISGGGVGVGGGPSTAGQAIGLLLALTKDS